MKSELEIKAMGLEDLQKFVVDLKQVPTNDKGYANAKALLDFAAGLKKYKEPTLVEVKNMADHDVPVDGKVIPKDGTAKVFPWQASALSRWLEVVEPVKAAIIILALLLSCCLTAHAQNQSYVLGSASQYNVLSIAGFNGGTNSILGTNTFITPVYTTNTIISPNWQFNGSGIWTNVPTTNNVITATNIPGIVSLVNYDMGSIYWGFALMAGGAGTGTISFDTSDDMVNWTTNAISASLVANGTAFVGTNINLTLFAPGYVRLNTEAYPSPTVAQTNVVFEVARKPNRTGP